jgi:4-hydroxybenzoate polyprenyltransferase
MASLEDYWHLIVPEYMPMAIIGLLLGFVVTTQTFPNASFLLPILSVLFVIAGYNSYNAVIDKDIDVINKPKRPLPKRTLSERDAKYIAFFSYVLALIIAIFIDGLFFWMISIMVILTFLYSYPPIYLKKRYIIGTLLAVVLYSVLIPLAGWSMNPTQPIPIPIIFFMFMLGLPSGIMKDYVDISGDSFYKVRSLPIELGYGNSKLTIILFYLVSVSILVYQVYEKLIPNNFLALAIFYPFMIWNVLKLPAKFDPYTRRDSYFIRAMLLFIAVEITIMGLVIFNPTF